MPLEFFYGLIPGHFGIFIKALLLFLGWFRNNFII
jgi:hypothetical protein